MRGLVGLTTRSLSLPAPMSNPTSRPTPVSEPAVPLLSAAYRAGSKKRVKGSSSCSNSVLHGDIEPLKRVRERDLPHSTHISLWEHSSHLRLIGRGVPSVSCFSASVKFPLFHDGLPQRKIPSIRGVNQDSAITNCKGHARGRLGLAKTCQGLLTHRIAAYVSCRLFSCSFFRYCSRICSATC